MWKKPLISEWEMDNPPLPEYPRPQMQRDSYLNLNGQWEYIITDNDVLPYAYVGLIMVPYSPETILSGVGRTLLPGQTLWYRRKVTLPEGFQRPGGKVLLHFGAVDQEALVWLNGHEVAYHMGGYTAFSADVTDALVEGENELVVRVHDDTDASWHSRGKQRRKRGGIWYTPQSGIWQTVWMECIPQGGVTGLTIQPDLDAKSVILTVQADEDWTGEVELEGRRIAFTANRAQSIAVENLRPWSPEEPYLYPFEVLLGEDRVQSYFALRKIEVRADEKGVQRLFLNNKPYFHNGLLDQGYWPESLCTPPSDEAMEFDIEMAQDMGYNMLRKHGKIESMRWYYHCDHVGMLVWQDMVSGGSKYRFSTISAPLLTRRHRKDSHYKAFGRSAPESREEYRRELEEMILQLRNVPSIVLWVPFNEGWGQFDAAEACELIRRLDPTRLIDHASGWHDQRIGLIKSEHVYFTPYRFRRDRLGRAVVLSECGGYSLRMEGYTFNDSHFGYRRYASREALWKAYRRLYEEQILPAVEKGLSAVVYTQLSDVEDELNGLFTYDRRVIKLPASELKRLNQRINRLGGNER